MPAKRQYRVKGSNDFLILAAIFFFLGIWAVKDAWFPSDKVLKKHPLQTTAAFSVSGTVGEVNVAEGDSVGEGAPLAKLRTEKAQTRFDQAVDEYASAKAEYETLRKQGTAESKADLVVVKEKMDAVHEELEMLRVFLDSAELQSSGKGHILEVKVIPHTMVDVTKCDAAGSVTDISDAGITLVGEDGKESVYALSDKMMPLVEVGDSLASGDTLAGEIAFVLDPKDHFYSFNKSLTVVSAVLFLAFMGIHIFAR